MSLTEKLLKKIEGPSDIRTYSPSRHHGIIILKLINQSKKKVIEKITQIIPTLQREKNKWIYMDSR
jgi:hypothetical protein